MPSSLGDTHSTIAEWNTSPKFCQAVLYILPTIQARQLTINYVSPRNNNIKPYCQWDVYFSHNLPVARGMYNNLCQHISEYKPRNTTIKLSAQNVHNFIVTYNVTCICYVQDFDVADKANPLVNYSYVDPVKAEDLKLN